MVYNISMKTIAENRQVRHEYFIEDSYEAGLCLEGSEVKSIRAGSVNLKDSFCYIRDMEVFVKNMHVAVYDKSGAFNTRDAKRDRKLLLNKREILKIKSMAEQKGYALVPVRLYYKDALIKMELGVCRGKHTFDKKETLKERDIKRSAERDIRSALRK
ncbi:MAG: SsrA-binding protein SmpB [Clostridia bacterium]|nr:SsrA-binding protein SmpB [Clostridia bacterium]MBR2969133.1 SsrA-binding protein SmpB [Clostridia bacterium]